MALHRYKRLRYPGFPDFVALAAVGMVVVFAVLWWRALSQPDWAEATGRVVQCGIVSTHYNAEPNRDKVSLVYEYEAEGKTFSGEFVGFWPLGGNPNALGPKEVPVALGAGAPLVVLYDPDNRSHSRLHAPERGWTLVYGCLLVGSLIFAAAYNVKVYAAWRRR